MVVQDPTILKRFGFYGFSIFDHLHSLEEYWSLFDLIWWKLEVPFFPESV
jgi:hypothetical protein